MVDPDAANFWQGLYDTGETRWDLGGPAPPLAAYFADQPAAGRAIVPGCGRGHDALMLVERGWQVTGVDFAASAVAAARTAASSRGLAAEFVQLDWFTAADQPGWRGAFDLVVEHTCFCAIEPARRDDYVDTVAALLRPGGQLVGLLWACGREGGPPFHADPDQTRAQLGRRLTIDRLEPATGSWPTRVGEWFVVAHV
jgi:SAM-dependent methyltransferase